MVAATGTALLLLISLVMGRLIPGIGSHSIYDTTSPVGVRCSTHPVVVRVSDSSPRPPQMAYPAQVVFDGSTCRLLLFGPCCQLTNHSLEAQTWLWDGHFWGLAHPPTSPPGLIAAAIAYDEGTQSVVLFGGIEEGPGRVGKTWIWKDGTWTPRQPAHSPSPREGASAVYDEARKQVVLIGGNTQSPGSNDTWTWDGIDWQLEHPDLSPGPKLEPGLAYDRARHEVVLFGGYTPTLETNDTWTWDGFTWTEQHPNVTPPANADFQAIGYDASSQKVVLVLSVGYVKHETWTWDGLTWTQEHPSTKLPARSNWQLVYDDAVHELVLYETWGADGNAYGPTSAWIWTGTDWKPAGS